MVVTALVVEQSLQLRPTRKPREYPCPSPRLTTAQSPASPIVGCSRGPHPGGESDWQPCPPGQHSQQPTCLPSVPSPGPRPGALLDQIALPGISFSVSSLSLHVTMGFGKKKNLLGG